MDYKFCCFGTYEEIAKCGVCEDRGFCECETKYVKGNEKNERKKNK